MRTPNKEQVQINNALLNTITPLGGLDFLRNKLLIGENVAKYTPLPSTRRALTPAGCLKSQTFPAPLAVKYSSRATTAR